jgi:hypothetical protein
VTGLDAARLAGLLAEPDRRLVVAALILRAGELDDVVGATGLDPRTAATALERLVQAGLVERGVDGSYVVLGEAFKRAARATADDEPSPEEHAAAPPSHQALLARSIVDGRLVHLPAKRAKRRIVLDRLAQELEPGVRYRERAVNAILRPFDADVATLRRYLVDEGFLDRAGGEYWRAGGSVEI